MGLGALTQGFQQGVNFMQNVDYRKQRRDVQALDLKQLRRNETAAQDEFRDVSPEEIDEYGQPVLDDDLGEEDQDPFLFRMVNSLKKKFKPQKRAAMPTVAPAASAQQISPTTSTMVQPPADEWTTGLEQPDEWAMADGGMVDPRQMGLSFWSPPTQGFADGGPAKDLRRAEEQIRAAAAQRQRVEQSREAEVEAEAAAQAAAGRARRIDQAIDPESRHGETLVRPPAAPRGGLRMNNLPPMQAGEAAVAPQSTSGPQRRFMRTPTPKPTAMPTSRGAPAQAPTSAAPQLGDALDLSNVDFSETDIPDMKVDDWKRYRARALRSARMRGESQVDARDAVDAKITQMQIRGFSNYAAQAAALIDANNLKGAARALRAAYQYFPDGNDAKFGVQNGKLVAVGIDEKTGKPFEGSTRVITREFLAGAIQNFTNPQNYTAWTKDHRDEAHKERVHNEIDKPTAEANVRNARTNAEANVARAEAAGLRAQLSGGGGGIRPTDLARSGATFRDELAMMKFDDPDKYYELTSIMSQLQSANKDVPAEQIIQFVLRAQKRPDGARLIQKALGGM